MLALRGVAQFGSVLEWGSRGREFESRHSDQGQFSRFVGTDLFVLIADGYVIDWNVSSYRKVAASML